MAVENDSPLEGGGGGDAVETNTSAVTGEGSLNEPLLVIEEPTTEEAKAEEGLVDEQAAPVAAEKKKKQPRKVLHFSDGILEEYSTSEDEELEGVAVGAVPNQSMVVDKSQLTWGKWVWFMTTASLSKVLAAADYAGEALASFFGITTPKYQFEYDEYQRMLEEEKQREQKLKEQMAGWKSDGTITSASTVVTSPGVSADDVKLTALEGNTKKPDTRPRSDKWERY